MLKLKAAKTLIQHHVASTTGQALKLKDLHNLARVNRSGGPSVEEVVQEMKKEKGIIIILHIYI